MSIDIGDMSSSPLGVDRIFVTDRVSAARSNMKSSESSFLDTDIAKEMMRSARLNILMQAGNNMMAQSNQLPQSVLSLLRCEIYHLYMYRSA